MGRNAKRKQERLNLKGAPSVPFHQYIGVRREFHTKQEIDKLTSHQREVWELFVAADILTLQDALDKGTLGDNASMVRRPREFEGVSEAECCRILHGITPVYMVITLQGTRRQMVPVPMEMAATLHSYVRERDLHFASDGVTQEPRISNEESSLFELLNNGEQA
jgi:hypothetical protein